MIDTKKLLRFMDGYFGYGDLSAPFWFIGMEEGGEATVEHMNATLDRWRSEGCPVSVEFAPEGNTNPAFSGDRPPIQRTWGKLIAAVLASKEVEASNDAIRSYQKTTFARPNTEACLLELMPLPARKVSDWNYDQLSDIPYLRTRKEYIGTVMPRRIESLRQLVQEHQPKAVIFYGRAYFPHWCAIVGNGMPWTDRGTWKECKVKETSFFSMPHPTAYGTKTADFISLGEAIRSL